MSQTKTYTTDAALTVASGTMLCSDFGDVHEFVTDMAGWPVMTHHMADHGLMNAVQAKVIRQVPWMPGAIENMPTFSDGPDAEAAVKAHVARIVAAHGPTVELASGSELPMLGLFHGLGAR